MPKAVAQRGKPCPRCGVIHPKCLAHNRQGKACGNAPGPNGKVCRNHGGKSPQAVKGVEDRTAAAGAVAAVEAFGLPRDIDPATALLEEVGRSAGAVEWLRARVVEAGADPADLVHGVRLIRRKSTPEGGETTTEVGPGVHLWVTLWQQERRHLADVCAKALAAGVDERRVRLAERMGAQLADVIRAVLDDLHLTREQRALVPQVVPRHLRALAGL